MVITWSKLFMSKVKDNIRKEGKDRKKDVVGLPGFISRLVTFSLVMFWLNSLVDLIILQTWWFLYHRGWSWIYLVFMKSHRRRKDTEKDLENRREVGLLELLLTFLLSACHLWECLQSLFSSKSFMKPQRKEREREEARLRKYCWFVFMNFF